MLGVTLASLGIMFDEISNSIGKFEVSRKRESIYTMGFLNLFLATFFFILYGVISQKYIFSFASLPTFCTRAILEIVQMQLTLKAVCLADRSTFGFIRVLTIPLLLITDLLIGYQINNFQLAGIILIIFTLFIFFSSQSFNKKGAWLALFTAINAVITISLYKYDITHFNSVAAEQSIISIILMIYFFLMATYFAKENPLNFLKQPAFLVGQSVAQVPASLLTSFAYNFAPASIILTTIRSSSVFWSVVSGSVYFKEKNIILKIACLFLIVGGLVLLVI